MAVFTGKQILRAVFTNNTNDTIEVVYNHKEDGEPPEYISVWVPATNPTNSELIGLKDEGWSFDRIQRETHALLEQQKQAYEARLYKVVESKVKEQLEHYYQIVNEEANARIKTEVDKYYQIVNEEANARIKEEVDKYYQMVNEEANARIKTEVDKYYQIVNEEANARIKEEVDRYYQIVNEELNAEANARIKTEVDRYYQIVNEEATARVKQELDKYYQEADVKVKQNLDSYYQEADQKLAHARERIAQIYDSRYNEMLDAGPTVTTNILQALLDNNTDEDVIFKTKLAIFDLQQIKDLKDRALKQKIRTAKTLAELLGALHVALADK
jgi:hypothetical protein